MEAVMGEKTQVGSCHCGAVRFEVDVAPDARVSRCNCTICRRTAVTSTVVKPAAFRLLAGKGNLSEYQWGARISKRFFCKTCGIHCFGPGHLPELGGDYVSVNLSCVDGLELDEAKIVYWDGRHDNWQMGPRNTPWPVGSAA
jgi:hypothetical protein